MAEAKSGPTPGGDSAFYVSQGMSPSGRELLKAQPSSGSPWGSGSQHGGPPAALLTRAVERLGGVPERTLGRITMELLGPVPVGLLSVEATVVRPGRNVELCEATLRDEESGRAVARAAAWRFPVGEDGPGRARDPLPHGPDDGRPHPAPGGWSDGYLDAVEWRWVKGSVTEPGPGVAWMRPRVPLVAGEAMTPLQRLMACADSASGVSAELDHREWGFQNPELTVHVLRPPQGEWVCLDAETTLGSGRVGMATSRVYDEHGLVARTGQALLLTRRQPNRHTAT